jgi:hypothetical protein
MHTVTLGRILAVLTLYGALLIVARTYGWRASREERLTAQVVAAAWAVATFVLNYLLYLAGVMSFMPWTANFLHTFVWIGGVLTVLYMGVRRRQSLLEQMVLFAVFSLVVKVAEQILFGTWEHDHFFHVFKGNTAYVLGWSLADGLYPPITLFGLRFLASRVSGLVPV